MELDVNILYALSLDVGQCIEKKIKKDISDFERLIEINKNECLNLLGDIETCIDLLQWVEKGFFVSALVLQKHEYEFSVADWQNKAQELNLKLRMPIYVITKNHGILIFALLVNFLATKKDIYGEENINIYFKSMLNAFKNQNK